LTDYRDIKTTKEIISTMVYAGVDIIEMSIFSDPITDRPNIQEVSYNTLEKCITLQRV
jgi:tryptophan synthase alpha subunit